MKVRNIFFIILILTSFKNIAQPSGGTEFNFEAYFKAFSLEDTILFDQQLNALDKVSGEFKQAFRGAILMKKSKFMKTIREKLDMFKVGRNMLESSIKRDSANVEYRFLRLATQENAPLFLNYNSDKQADAQFIVTNFQLLPKSTQEFILKYSEHSEVLKPEDLKK